jgi:hypothetical protein
MDFRGRVRKLCDTEIRQEQPKEPFDLQTQPTFRSLQALQELFAELKSAALPATKEPQRQDGDEGAIFLSAYELAEIVRLVRNDDIMDALDKYWKALYPPDPPDGTPKDTAVSAPLLQAVGAMAIDAQLRFRAWHDLTAKTRPTILEQQGFKLNADEEKLLLETMPPGGVACNMGDQFFSRGWSGHTCTSLATAYPGWLHVNV